MQRESNQLSLLVLADTFFWHDLFIIHLSLNPKAAQ